MWMKRWCIVFALAVFGCGAFCSCGKSDAAKNAVEDTSEETEEKSKITFEYEGEYTRENSVIVIVDYYDVQKAYTNPNSEIKAMGNPMMLTQFRKDFRRMREELEEADITKEITDKLTESIKNMERILEAFMIENEAGIKAKSEKKKVKIVRP